MKQKRKKYFWALLLSILILSGCGDTAENTDKSERSTVIERQTQETTQNELNKIKKEEECIESFESRIAKLQKYADDKTANNAAKERIQALWKKFNANKNDVTEDNIGEYESELSEITEMLDIPDEEAQHTSDELFLEQNEHIIMTLGDDGAYYKLNDEDDSITVFSSDREIINIMYLTEDGEEYSVFTDEKGNEFVLSRNEDGELIFTDTAGETKILSEIE